jgi:hypothetical protein
MQVEDEIKFALAESFDRVQNFSQRFSIPVFAPHFGAQGNDLVDIGVAAQDILKPFFHHPCDVGIGQGFSQRGGNGKSVDDISQGAELKD